MRKIMTLTACLLVVLTYTCAEAKEDKGAKMDTVKNGDMIKLHYEGTLDDGSVFDSSKGREPLEFKVGSGQVIPGFDEAVLKMKVGEEKTFTIPAHKAYGERDPKLVTVVDRKQFPQNMKLSKGLQAHFVDENGSARAFTITEVNDTKVTVDANHQLAGEALTFKIVLKSIGR